MAPRIDRVPDEEPRTRDCQSDENKTDQSLEPRAANSFIGKGQGIVIDEMGEDGRSHSMAQEEIAEAEACDHARDDLPPAPAGRVREPEDRGAGKQESPRGDEGFFRRITTQDAADQVSPCPGDVMSRRSGAVAGRPAVHVHDPQDDRSEGHREPDQDESEDDFLVDSGVCELEQEDPRVLRCEVDG